MPRVASRVAYRVAYPNPIRVSQALLSSIQYLVSIYTLNLSISNNIIANPVPFLTIAEKYFDMFPGTKTIQTFDDRSKDTSKARIFHFTGRMPSDLMQSLYDMNMQGIGIYMAVNETDGKGRKTENVVRVRSLFADLDGAPLEPAMALNPTLVVESSPNRFHCYWFTEDTPLEAFTYMQKQIARIFSSDKSVHDWPRVLRVPGFMHQKEGPYLTNVHGGSAIIYSYRDLVEMFPPEPVNQFSGQRYTVKKSGNGDREFKGLYGATDGERNAHVIKRVGGMVKRGKTIEYIEQEILREAVACQPPLDDKDISKLLQSARRYAGGE